jgi:hypothetical protein
VFTQGQVIEFIERVFGDGVLSNQGNNISVTCPRCLEEKGSDYEKKKLVISTDKCLLHCWVCGYKARNLVALLRRHHSEYLQEYLTRFLDETQLAEIDSDGMNVVKQPLRLPDDFELLAMIQDDRSWQVQRAIEYLNVRGLGNEQSLWYWKFGISREEDNWKHRVIIPSFDEEGKLNYYTGRAFLPRLRPKYLNPPVAREEIIFNELNIDWKEPLVIVEGPFDTTKAGSNASCLLGSDLTEEYRLFQKIIANETPVTLALDRDVLKKQNEIAKRLSSYCVEVKIVELPSPWTDVGEMSSEEFTRILKQAIPWSVDYSIGVSIAGVFR